MRRLLSATTALAISALYLGGAGAANATPSPVTITGTYTIGETYSDATNNTGGGPAITGNLGTGIVNSATGTTGTFSFSLTPGGAYTTPVNLATFSPDNNKCEGPGCTGGPSGTETDPINISFTFTAPSGAAATTDTASFTAKYNYPYLACDPGGDGHGKSDCVQWGTSPIVANFTDGAVMNIKLNNASDWDITPTIAFQLVSGPTQVAAPEPASIALLGFGLLGTVALARRRRA